MSLLQQVRLLGVHVVGTATERNFDVVRRFGGVSGVEGNGLEARLRELAPAGYAAALDTVGTDEAVDASLRLVSDPARIVTLSAGHRAEHDGFRAIGGTMPASAAFRDGARAGLLSLAVDGDFVVPLARSYPLAEAKEALAFLQGGHPGGKISLIVGSRER